MVDAMPGVDHARTGAARRRRERRLRAYLRYARMSVQMALAEASHHTAPRGQRIARAREEEREVHYTAAFRTTVPPPEPELFDIFEEPGGGRPDLLLEPQGPQLGVQRHAAAHIEDIVPYVQILDAPVPLVGDQVVDAFRHLDLHVPVQVIEVPKISSSRRRCRRRRVPVVQAAEQLVEVPGFVQLAALLQQDIAAHGSLQGFLPGQDYLVVWEQIVDLPVPQDFGGLGGDGGFQGFSPGQGTPAADVEQIVHIPGSTGRWWRSSNFFPWTGFNSVFGANR